MKENLINLSFLARGLVFQDIVVTTDEPIAAEELVRMLNSREASTSIHEDNNVILADGTVIGTVRFSETELDFAAFHVEDGNYEQESVPATFNATRVALAAAVGEYIDEPDMTIDEVMGVLTVAGGRIPGLEVVEAYEALSGNQLLKEIRLTEQGFMSLMKISYNAAKLNQEMV